VITNQTELCEISRIQLNIIVFWAVLRVELRASHLQGRHYCLSCSPTLFALIISEIGLTFCAGGWDRDLPILCFPQ
jgi:hypothetical protein